MSLRDALESQAESCRALGSPLTARVLHLIAENLRPGSALRDRLWLWPGDIGPGGASVPLRLAGGLHALVLNGQAPELARAYGQHEAVSDNRFWRILAAVLDCHADFLMRWLDSPPQTNEVRRAAVLIAAGHWLHARHGLPLVLSELGASAGLNMLWDHYALEAGGQRFGPAIPCLTLTPEWHGPLPPVRTPQIADRAGADLNPLDPVQDQLRLLSYIWADQPDRLERTRKALAMAARLHPPVARADAVDWLATRLAQRRKGQLHLICHTIAWQYLAPEAKARGEAIIAAAGAGATKDAPIAWFAMEADGTANGAALILRLWPGDLTLAMGRADFHGRWVRWSAPE